MHKGIICLTNAESVEEAQEKVELFLEKPSDKFDWYQIGGRWNSLIGENNIMPLKECLNKVKEYVEQKGVEERIKQLEMNTTVAYSENKYMKGTCYKVLGNLLCENFCDDCDLFNIDDEDYSIPENTEGWYAIVVDIHS